MPMLHMHARAGAVAAVFLLVMPAGAVEIDPAGVTAPGAGPELDHVIEVSASDHAAGEYTVQDAFDELPEAGGVVQLGEGTFELDRATTPEDVAIRVEGQGPAATIITGTVALVLSPAPHAEVTNLGFEELYRGVELTDDGGYGHVKFHQVHFTDIDHASIRGGVPGPIDRITVTECRFESVHSGAGFRNGESRQITVTDNEFHNITTRPMVLGAGSGDNRYAQISHNHIDGVGPGRHPIGILAYVDDAIVEHNTIKNIINDGRHEGISNRGGNSVLRHNTLIDAGGHTAAISLAGRGPTLVTENHIEFTDAHEGQRDGIDIRQNGHYQRVVNNRIIGSRRGINSRRGGLSHLEDNYIGDSKHQTWAINYSISTGTSIPAEAMRDVTIIGNEIANIEREEGDFHGIRFNIRNHAADYDTRLDHVRIADNVIRDVRVGGTATGITFTNLSRDDSHMRDVVIENNDLRHVDVPINRGRHHVEELTITNNPGFESE